MSINDWQGTMLGRYRLLTLLGRGGMGDVWLAEDTRLHRQVAVKLLSAVLANDNAYLQDFAYEARAAAALEHPHILPVHDFGEQWLEKGEIVTYLVMPHITGGTLRARIQNVQGPLLVDEAMQYLQQAAAAIDYAHSQNVLHRDIKPANMLLQQGWLLLADFGIAKLLTSGTQRSRTHRGAGTPEYIAPEQAQGNAVAASDRYSLALVAYQLFTGHVPFRGENAYETLLKQVQQPPPPPSQFNPRIPYTVEEVLLKGLAKRPEERPASCMEFVSALGQGWRTGAVTQLDPDATLLAPWSKQRQVQQAATVIHQHNTPPFSPSAQTGPAIMPVPNTPHATNTPMQPTMTYGSEQPTWHQQHPQTPQAALPPSPAPAPPTEYSRQHIGRRALVIGGATAVAAAIVGGGFALNTFMHHTTTPTVSSKTLPGPQKFMSGVPILNLTGHTDKVWNVVWDSKAEYLATAGDDSRVMLWKVGDTLRKKQTTTQAIAQPQAQWKFSQGISYNALCWVNDRFLAVTPAEFYKFYLIDTVSNATTYQTYVDSSNANSFSLTSYTHVSWSTKHSAIAVTEFPEPSVVSIALWSIKDTQKPLREIKDAAAPNGVTASTTCWSPDGSYLAGTLNNFHNVVWDVKTGNVAYTLALPKRTKQQTIFTLRDAILWSPIDQHQLLTTNIDVLSLWDIRKQQQLLSLGTDDPITLQGPTQKTTLPWIQNVIGIAWSPNGRYVAASYGRSHKVYVWDLQEKTPRLTKDGVRLQSTIFGDTNGHSNTIIDLQWSPDGRYLATTSFDKTVIVWQVDAA